MLRIIGGRFRGRTIPSPRGRHVRPTTALIRESIFNRFQWQVPGCRFLDLFAGSGIIGLEALSRGAAFVLGVEQVPAQCRRIQEHYRSFGLTEAEARAVAADVQEFLSRPCREAPFDLIFMDPPYGYEALPELVHACRENDWLSDSGIIIVEHSNRDPELEDFQRVVYGDTALSWATFVA